MKFKYILRKLLVIFNRKDKVEKPQVYELHITDLQKRHAKKASFNSLSEMNQWLDGRHLHQSEIEYRLTHILGNKRQSIILNN